MEALNKINKQIDVSQITATKIKSNSDKDLKQVAEEFESLFINEMLKRAHSAKLAKTILTSEAEDTYTSLLNQERSKTVAKSHNFGIAEALVNQFSRKSRPKEYSYNKQVENK